MLTVCGSVPLLFAIRGESYGLPSDRAAPDFSLRTVSGAELALADFAGRYLFLMFGYLNCPDMCHTQALTFEALAGVAGPRDDLAFAYVAIDPRRDSPDQVGAYFDQRGDGFVSLHGSDEGTLQALAADYRAFFSRHGDLSADDYEVDHTALFFLVDPTGKLRYTYAANQNNTSLILDDLARLQAL